MYAIAARANAPAGLTHRPLTRTSGSSLKLNSDELEFPGGCVPGCVYLNNTTPAKLRGVAWGMVAGAGP